MIEIYNLTKKYGEYSAVDNISMDIGKGITGLLGANGAGKTTLIRMLATILYPSSGSIKMNNILLCGKNAREIKKIIGYMPQDFGFYPDMTTVEFLTYIALMQELTPSIYKPRIDELLEKLNLADNKNKKTRHLSGGMKRRLGFAQAMINDPEILIVDEPTAGLDPEERIRMRNLLSEFSKDRTVLLSTHIVEDIASIAPNIAVLTKGKLIYHGNKKDALSVLSDHIYTLTLSTESETIRNDKRIRFVSQYYVNEKPVIRFITFDDNFAEYIKADRAEPSLEDYFVYANMP